MSQSTIFTNNRSQAIRLPADARFPDLLKKVDVRVVSVITPADAAWDGFFLNGPDCSADFMQERASQHQSPRGRLRPGEWSPISSTPTSPSTSSSAGRQRH